jgi:hypothetical protein
MDANELGERARLCPLLLGPAVDRQDMNGVPDLFHLLLRLYRVRMATGAGLQVLSPYMQQFAKLPTG